MDFFNALRNLIRRGVVTGGADNSATFPVQQVSYLKKISDCYMIFPYGMYANASSNDSLVTLFSVEGDDAKKAGIPQAAFKRPKDLEPGEVAFYHPETDSFIKYRNSGNLEIESGNGGTGNVIVNAAQVNINATTSVTFDTPTVTFTGNVNIEGDATLGKLADTPKAIARLGDAVAGGVITGGSIRHKAT